MTGEIAKGEALAYEEPEMEVVVFGVEDIVTASDEGVDLDPEPGAGGDDPDFND